MSPHDTLFVEHAALVSRIAHDAVGQKRKYTGEPYWHHCANVAETVLKIDGTTPEMIAAAYLHDTVEDTRLTVNDIAREFGLVVSGYVAELTDQFTDPAQGNRAERKAAEAERLSKISPRAQTIKYADLIDNTSSIVKHDPGFARIYLAEKRRILTDMVDGDQGLWRQAWSLLVEGEARLTEHRKTERESTPT